MCDVCVVVSVAVCVDAVYDVVCAVDVVVDVSVVGVFAVVWLLFLLIVCA